MSTTTNLAITKLDAGVRQPEIIINDALDALDAEIGGSMQAWTPTWTNLTLGNGTVTAKYKKVGKMVHCRVHVLFGSSTSISGSVTFTLPVTAATLPGTINLHALGRSRFYDASVPVGLDGVVTQNSTTTALLAVLDSSGTYAKAVTLSSSVPFSWAVSDELTAVFSYEAA